MKYILIKNVLIHLTIHITGKMGLLCARSLENVDYPLDIIVDKNIGTTVNGREYVWYDIEKKDENCYEIIKNGKSTGKYCNTQQKVEKKIKWKQQI